MGLLPLEFSDCLLDSPYFRENLKAHEKQLDQTASHVKGIEKSVHEVLEAAKTLSRAKRSLASSLASFQFDCLGASLTDDEVIIANSLREFARFLDLVEDEMDRMLENAHEKFISPLETFRKEQIGSVRKTKKDFDKQTARFCAVQDRYVNTSSRREESLAEAAEQVRLERRNLNASSLEYVYLMHVVQERKKVEFVEAIVCFMQSWATYYKHGLAVTSDFSQYMSDLQSRVQKTRGNFSATVEQYEQLKQKMQGGHQDPGLLNKMYTRQGYLYAQNRKTNSIKLVGSGWTKYYCQYQAKSKTLTLIPYSQMSGKISTTESVRVHECVCKDETSAEKFRFVVTGEDLNEVGSIATHTFQALSDYERKHWVEAMGGTWPALNTLQRIRADSVEDNLNSLAFTFLKDCLAELESRGLNDQGLYRVGGVVSKVKKLLNQGLDPQKSDPSPPLDLSDPKQWESKTIASAVKQYFRDLNKPLMTHHLYASFVEAVKHESEEERLSEIELVMRKLPPASREMLKVLVRHLSKVAANCTVNLMTASNLGVCFGPTLLRPKEETVASIMDIKFCNEVIEILIAHCDDRFFPVGSHPSPEVKHFDVTDNGRANRGSSTPLRANSLSSFSQLSTNSLPDIKELKDPLSSSAVMRNPAGERPRSKSHQVQQPLVLRPDSTVGKQTSLPPYLTPTLTKSSSTQDDLMASLEMMNLLAADLPHMPTSASPLRRSQTLQPNRKTSLDVTRKPPLPKIDFQPAFIQQQRHNSSPSPSSASSADSSAASPRPSRPSDLLSRLQAHHQQQLVIDEANELHLNAAADPPAVPTRKYRRVSLDQSPLLNHRGYQHRTNASMDSGVITSPSPPVKDDDAISVSSFANSVVSSSSSSSSSEAANLSASSKYDNLKEEHQSRDEDGDDEAEDDANSVVSESRLQKQQIDNDSISESVDNKFCTSASLRLHVNGDKRSNYRDSAYDNVPSVEDDDDNEVVVHSVTVLEDSLNLAPKTDLAPKRDFLQEKLSEQQRRKRENAKFVEEDRLFRGDGMSSLRSMLASGRTTDI